MGGIHKAVERRECQACREPLPKYASKWCHDCARSTHIARTNAAVPATERRDYHLAWRRKWRAEAFKALGGCCARCGFTNEHALQIDHVNGDGHKERKQWSNGGYFCRRVVREAASGRYQLLCANCNWIKRAENQEFRRHPTV